MKAFLKEPLDVVLDGAIYPVSLNAGDAVDGSIAESLILAGLADAEESPFDEPVIQPDSQIITSGDSLPAELQPETEKGFV